MQTGWIEKNQTKINPMSFYKTLPYACPFKYRLASPLIYQAEVFDPTANALFHSNDFLFATIFTGTVTLYPFYASDGATWCPDFQSGMRGFFLHDFPCQMQFVPDFRRLFADRTLARKWLKDILTQDKCPLRRTINLGVAIGDKFYSPTVHPGVTMTLV